MAQKFSKKITEQLRLASKYEVFFSMFYISEKFSIVNGYYPNSQSHTFSNYCSIYVFIQKKKQIK